METPASGRLERVSLSRHKGLLAAPDGFAGYARIAGALRKAGHYASADMALRQARILSPDEPRLLVNAANLWLSTGLAGDPLRALRRALCLDPEFAPAADRLLLLRKAFGDSAGAIRVARWCVCRRPVARLGALLELSLLVLETGDKPQAKALLWNALEETVRAGMDPGPLFRLAKHVGGGDFLVRVIRVLLCVSPASETAARALASAPVDDGSQWPTRAILSRLSLVMPTDPVIQNGTGVFLEHHGWVDGASKRYIKAAILDPALSISIFNLGARARNRGEFSRAIQLFERVLLISPDDLTYQYNLGHVLLATGDAERGLRLYEERWCLGERQSHRRGGSAPSFPQPVWDDAAPAAVQDSVLIWGEQGLGDEIWFAGYVPRLFAGHRAVLECDGRLTGLFTRSQLARTVVSRVDPPHPAAVDARRQIAAGSLPLLASTRQSETLRPTPGGYLKVDQSRAANLRERLTEIGDGQTVGISWRSRKPNPVQSFEAPIEHWKPVLELHNATFVNLQYDATAAELDDIRMRYGIPLVAFDDIDPLCDIDDLAALISVLDHVVSIANINVTLCHGVGRDCHVALRHYQDDWKFQRNRTESPWLPQCQLYWSTREGEWGPVFSRIADNLP